MWTDEEKHEMVRQQLVFGDVELDDNNRPVMDRKVPDPWEYYYRVGGRGWGKTSMVEYLRRLHEEVQRVIDKTDELHRMAAGWRTAPQPREIPDIAGVHWRCTTPTGYVSYSQLEEKYRAYTRGIVDGLAGRDLLDIITDAKNKARGAW
jgi:hypothetical protein